MTRLRVIEFVAPGVEAIAERRGLYADHGVEVETVRTRSSTEQRERMMSDDCDVALTAIDNLIAWNAGGDDLRLVGQVERTTVLDLVAGVERIEDLRGATLAVDAVDTGFAIVLRKILRDHGLDSADYTLLAAGGIQQRCDAITGGRAAAGLLGPPWSDQALAQGLHRLITVEAALPGFPGIGVAVRAARLAQLRAPVRRLPRRAGGRRHLGRHRAPRRGRPICSSPQGSRRPAPPRCWTSCRGTSRSPRSGSSCSTPSAASSACSPPAPRARPR